MGLDLNEGNFLFFVMLFVWLWKFLQFGDRAAVIRCFHFCFLIMNEDIFVEQK